MRRLQVVLLSVLSVGLAAASLTGAQEGRVEQQEPKERPTSPHVEPAPSPTPLPSPPPAPMPASPPALESTGSGPEPRTRSADPGEWRDRVHAVGRTGLQVDRAAVRVAVPPEGGLPTRANTIDPPETTLPSYSRPRQGRPIVGSAVSRPEGGYYPPDWDWGYHWGYYPWGFGLWSYYYDPFWDWGPDYVGYYGGTAYVATNVGHLKIKVKPSKAQVYVDGYFVGIVDEFDGPFQRLSLPEGPHKIEVRTAGFATLSFDVRVLVRRTLTVRGEMQRQP